MPQPRLVYSRESFGNRGTMAWSKLSIEKARGQMWKDSARRWQSAYWFRVEESRNEYIRGVASGFAMATLLAIIVWVLA